MLKENKLKKNEYSKLNVKLYAFTNVLSYYTTKIVDVFRIYRIIYRYFRKKFCFRIRTFYLRLGFVI